MFIAWAIIMVAFFVLAVQLFITILEFKLTRSPGWFSCRSRSGTRRRFSQSASSAMSSPRHQADGARRHYWDWLDVVLIGD